MLLFLFLNHSLILFNSCSYCIIFFSIAELVTFIGIPNKEGEAEIELHSVTAEAKIRKSSIFIVMLSLKSSLNCCFLVGNSA